MKDPAPKKRGTREIRLRLGPLYPRLEEIAKERGESVPVMARKAIYEFVRKNS